MYRLFPCIPIFNVFFCFGLKLQKGCVYVIMLKIALVLLCFDVKKGYKQIIALDSPKTYC